MVQLLELADAYLETPSTDYAIMIDGPWGSGKTFFWKNTVVPRIESQKAPGGEPRHRAVYVSLYGITRPEEIAWEVFLALHPLLARKTSKVLTGIARIAMKFVHLDPDILKVDPKDWANLDNVVLCFDDLERCRVSVSDTLGTINQYVEHAGVKTFILCNEKGIGEDDQVEYRQIKEKVVGRTVQFQPDFGAVLDSLIPLFAKQPEYKVFLAAHRKTILELFQRSGSKSLRILKQSLYNLGRVYAAIDAKSEYADSAAIDAMDLVLPLTFDYGRGEATEQQVHEIATEGISLFGSTLLRTGPDEKDYYAAYSQRYFDGDSWGALVSPAGARLITAGVLDHVALSEDLRQAYVKGSPLEVALAALFGNYYNLSDADFRKHWATTLEGINTGVIRSFAVLYRLFSYARYWAQLGIIGFGSEEVSNLFYGVIEKGIATTAFAYADDLPHNLSMVMIEGDEAVRQFRDHLLKLNSGFRRNNDEARGRELLTAIKEQGRDGIRLVVNELYDVPIFEVVKAVDMADAVRSLPNDLKMLFQHALERRYITDPIREITRLEHAGLLRVSDELQKVVDEDSRVPRQLSSVLLSQTIKKIKLAAVRVAPPTPEARGAVAARPA
jgi:hypothetical protein